MNGQALIVQGDALALPLPDASVDLIVTSPPYFALRAYDAGSAQIGGEPTPAEYLEALWAATAEMMRVVKPTGSIFVDLGDKYSGAQAQNFNSQSRTNSADVWAQTDPRRTGIPNKSLMLLPERYRVGCVDQLGLIARAVLVWNKPNGLPESVTDRVRRSHEDWVHLVKQPRYYSATDEVREPYLEPNRVRADVFGGVSSENGVRHAGASTYTGPTNPLGKLPGSVWTIPSEPLRLPEHLGVQHYAAFPSEWPRRLILGWSPPGICLECGQGRAPVVDKRQEVTQQSRTSTYKAPENGRSEYFNDRTAVAATILGYACSCTPFTDHPERRRPSVTPGPQYGREGAQGARADNGEPLHHGAWPERLPVREYHLDGWKPPPTRPAVVLDSFGGTGTTAMVARALGRIGVSVDLSRPYCRAARWRIHHDAGKAISRTNLERQGQLL